MSNKFDFDGEASEVVSNEPEIKESAVLNDSEMVSEMIDNDSATVDFEANGYDLVPSLVEGVGTGWRKLWGEGEGAKLTATEKEGMTSLLQRGCEHFGLVKMVSGTKGFIIAMIFKILGLTIPRIANEESRKYFVNNFLNDNEEEKSNESNNQQPARGYTNYGKATAQEII